MNPTDLRQAVVTSTFFKGVSEERQQAAFDFVKWMTDDERVAQWSIDTGYVATRPSAYDTERMQEYAKKNSRTAL